MARRHKRQLFSGRKSERRGFSDRSRRRFWLEPLESRCLLATFIVSNTYSSGAGSLDDAIQKSNALGGSNTIKFSLAPGSVIDQGSDLTPITVPVIIDATKSGTNVPQVEVHASYLRTLFTLNADGCVIKGLAITGSHQAIVINSQDNTIQGDYIGVDLNGQANGNYLGIGINRGTGNTIGGTTAAARNVISNNGTGITLAGNGNVVIGNYIGLDPAGSSAMGNSGEGVYITGSDNTVGGVTLAAGNVISANGKQVNFEAGVKIVGTVAYGTRNVVEGNRIGSSATGLDPMGNSVGVIVEDSAANTIGGTGFAGNEIVSSNGSGSGFGVWIDSSGAMDNVVQGNAIGANFLGVPLGNAGSGVYVSNGANWNTIGGTTTDLGNIITANAQGVLIDTSQSDSVLSNQIFGNTAALGIQLFNGANNNQPAPALSSVSLTNVAGTVTGPASTKLTVQFFANDPRADNNYQGQVLLSPDKSFTVQLDAQGKGNFSFTISGLAPGQYVTSTATDYKGNTSQFSNSLRLGALSVIVPKLNLTEGLSFSGTVANFTTPDTSARDTNFTATIYWGDGGTTNVGVSGSAGNFTVSGTHTYAEEGGFPLTVIIHDRTNNTDYMGNVDLSRSTDFEQEGTIAVDPTNPNHLFAASNRNGEAGVFAAYSTDGGATWSTRKLGTGNGPGGDGLPVSFTDPEAVFDQYGNLFLIYIDFTGNVIDVLLSTDGGKSFSVLTTLMNFPNVGGVDQTKITTGPGRNGVGGSVWISFLDTENRIATDAASVTGKGTVGTFGTPLEVVGSLNGNFDDIAIGPNGQALVTWQTEPATTGPATIYESLDSDGLGPLGWGPVQRITGTAVGGHYPVPPQANRTIDAEAKFAWDRSGGKYNGRVYMSYTDSPGYPSADTNIYLIYSDDNGATWSSPVRVNDDTGSNSQLLPSIAVDQSTGNVVVSWYDARNDPNNKKVQMFAAVSNNGGASFLPNFLVSTGTTDVSNLPAGNYGRIMQLGDYSTTTFANGVFYPIWVDNSTTLAGNPNPPQADMATQRIVVEQVADAPLTAKGADFKYLPNLAFSGTVATFTDANPNPEKSDFSATIDWGDGSSVSVGTIAASGNGFQVDGTHTYSGSGPYTITVTIHDFGGSSATAHATATSSGEIPPAPDAPFLYSVDDTGISATDGITRNNGSDSAPLSFIITGVVPATGFVRLYDVYNPANPVPVGDMVQALDGVAVVTLWGTPLADGDYPLVAVTRITPTGTPGPASSITTISIQTSLTIFGTLPAAGAVISALPGGDVAIGFAHPLAFTGTPPTPLTNNGPAISAGHPYAIFLSARGPDGFSGPSGIDGGTLPLPDTTTYRENDDGTSTIFLTPSEPLSSDVYLIEIDLGAYVDFAGNHLTDASGGFRTFLLQIPNSNVPPRVLSVTAHTGFGSTVVNNSAISQPDTLGIAFSKPLFAGVVGTVSGNHRNNVQLFNGSAGYATVPSVATYSPTTDTIYLTPTAALYPGSVYVIRVDASVSDDQGFGNPGHPLGYTYYDTFTVTNPPLGAGTRPMQVATDSHGTVQTLPASGVIWRNRVGFASIQFTEPLKYSALGRWSTMLIPSYQGLAPGNFAAPDNAKIPLGARLAYNPNTRRLVIVPTQPVGNDLYLYSLSTMQATNGDPLLNNAGNPAGQGPNPPYYQTFLLQTPSAGLRASEITPRPAIPSHWSAAARWKRSAVATSPMTATRAAGATASPGHEPNRHDPRR